jgi:tRNA-binding protein
LANRAGFGAQASSPVGSKHRAVTQPQQKSPALDAFDTLDIRVGTIVGAEPFPEVRKPAYKLIVDFGTPIGVKRSSAQITQHYRADDLIGTQVLAVVNFPPKRIAGFESEVLVLGVPDAHGNVVLVRPSANVPDGGRLF